jgi:hypothetical protein
MKTIFQEKQNVKTTYYLLIIYQGFLFFLQNYLPKIQHSYFFFINKRACAREHSYFYNIYVVNYLLNYIFYALILCANKFVINYFILFSQKKKLFYTQINFILTQSIWHFKKNIKMSKI